MSAATAVSVKDFVTVVSVDGTYGGGGVVVQQSTASSSASVQERPFVTVLSIGEEPPTAADATAEEEEVLVYRLPGERLGFGLRFDGVDACNRLFVQSCADGSPASRTQASWGSLRPGDEIVRINGRPVNKLSRDDCVRCLKESGLVVKLHMIDGRAAAKAPPPVPPRKQKKPEPPPPIAACSAVYTDAVERFVYHGESESDDTNSSVSTVVSKCPALSSLIGEDCGGGDKNNCVLDRVLEPFMQLEREFSSSAAIGDDVGLYEKLVAVAEEDRLPPKPLPRKEVRPPKKKPPPPPPPPLPCALPPPPAYRLPPRLVDFMHKDEPSQMVVDGPVTAVVNEDDGDNVFSNADLISSCVVVDDNDENTTAEQENTKEEDRETTVKCLANNVDASVSMKNADDDLQHREKSIATTIIAEIPVELTAVHRPPADVGPTTVTTMRSSSSSSSASSVSRTDSETDSDGPRNVTAAAAAMRRPGRTDEVCNRSVRDKIAMFSRSTCTDKSATGAGEKKDSASSSSAYSTASPDSSPAASPKTAYNGTATVRRRTDQWPQPSYQAVQWPSSNTTTAADHHRRSQSLVEQPYSKYFNASPYAEIGRSSLNALIEQRQRSMSKLRGLVIPEKATVHRDGVTDDRDLAACSIPDLPLVVVMNSSPPRRPDDADTAVLCPPAKTYVKGPPQPPAQPVIGTAIRHANPVKTTVVSPPPITVPASAEQHRRPSSASSTPSSSSSSSLNSSREELRHIHDERPPSSVKSKGSSFKADSDEDSALSSSRSSTSLQQYSPVSSPPPPPPPTSQLRTMMTTTTTNGTTAVRANTGKRVLKAESVEAINRKNVLCSARISSGKPEPPQLSSSFSSGNYVTNEYHQRQQQQQQVHNSSTDTAGGGGGGGGTPLKCSKTAFAGGNNNRYAHNRMPSVESTTSDDSSMQYAVNAEPFGSISSLASSTSLISQHELQQLIDDANQTSEENGCATGGPPVSVPPLPVEVTVVILHRDVATSSVGITLAGGADYETKEITVYKVLTGSPADKDGRIRKGDRILSINGKSMKGIKHRESLAILKAPRSEVVLVISRCKSDTAIESTGSSQAVDLMTSTKNDAITNRVFGPLTKVTLSKDGSGLGFSLEGGKNSPTGDQPLTVKKIFTGGCAEQCEQILAGDELVSVNDIDVTGMSRTEAWNLMKRLVNGTVTLGIRHVV